MFPTDTAVSVHTSQLSETLPVLVVSVPVPVALAVFWNDRQVVHAHGGLSNTHHLTVGTVGTSNY